jgi:metal-dependent amidase/aminoacylase/carboxypeptidase family protein
VDLIAAGSRIVLALHALPGREADARVPAVVTVARFDAGVRNNIIPGSLTLGGTIRALSEEVRAALRAKVVETAETLHSPTFYVDQRALIHGVRALSHITVEFLHDAPEVSRRR